MLLRFYSFGRRSFKGRHFREQNVGSEFSWGETSGANSLFLNQSPADLATAVDHGLFRAICLNPDHVLRGLILSTRQNEYHHRPRTHNFTVPQNDDRNYIKYIILFKWAGIHDVFDLNGCQLCLFLLRMRRTFSATLILEKMYGRKSQ